MPAATEIHIMAVILDDTKTPQMLYPSKHDTLNNVGLMLAHCLRRWPNIKPTLFQCVVFSGILYIRVGRDAICM